MAENREGKWWAWQGLNLRPLRCQGRDTEHFLQKTAIFGFVLTRTWREQIVIPQRVYRTFTAQGIWA